MRDFRVWWGLFVFFAALSVLAVQRGHRRWSRARAAAAEHPLAEQGGELVQRHHERDQVNDPDPAFQHPSGQPVIRREEPLHHCSPTRYRNIGRAALRRSAPAAAAPCLRRP